MKKQRTCDKNKLCEMRVMNQCVYPNGHSFFNLKTKNENRIKCTQTVIFFLIEKQKMKEEFSSILNYF